MVDNTLPDEQITADEIALYDRQIRLWGVKAQESLRKANILLVNMRALANEVAKNLVLAGINSLTVIDHELATEDDLGAQFFLAEDDVGKNVCFATPVTCYLNFG
jgi:ubiquitin-like 1-activating enzyme E1 A